MHELPEERLLRQRMSGEGLVQPRGILPGGVLQTGEEKTSEAVKEPEWEAEFIQEGHAHERGHVRVWEGCRV